MLEGQSGFGSLTKQLNTVLKDRETDWVGCKTKRSLG